MERKGKGIYFYPETREILRVSNGRADPGDGWIRISKDETLGLLAARNLVGERKLVDDVTRVDWFGMRAGTTSEDEEMSDMIRRFKHDSEEARKDTRNGTGLLGRLGARLRSVRGGAGSDAGPALQAVPIRVPVRSRDGENLYPS